VNIAANSLSDRFGAVQSSAVLSAAKIVYALDEAARGSSGAIAYPHSESRIP
jgi:hypothetical protein